MKAQTCINRKAVMLMNVYDQLVECRGAAPVVKHFVSIVYKTVCESIVHIVFYPGVLFVSYCSDMQPGMSDELRLFWEKQMLLQRSIKRSCL